MPLAGAAAATAVIGTAAAALARLPARPAVQPGTAFGQRPVSPLAKAAPGLLVPASAQRRPSRRSSARNLARISEAGSTFPPPKDAEAATSGSTAVAAQQPQQMQSPAQDMDASMEPADAPASKRARAEGTPKPALDTEPQPAKPQPAEDEAVTERPEYSNPALPPVPEHRASEDDTQHRVQQPVNSQQHRSGSSGAALPRETGSSAATAMVWNEVSAA